MRQILIAITVLCLSASMAFAGHKVTGNLIVSGNAGIGTTAPLGKLQVDGSIYAGVTAPGHAAVSMASSGDVMIGGDVEIDGAIYLDGATGTGAYLCIDANNRPYKNTTCP